MLANIMQVLSQAIRERHCIAIRYHDQRQVRVVEPHAVYSSDRGELVLDGYQTRGFSSSGRPTPFWRPFRLKRIAAITVLRENFEPRVAEGFSSSRLKYRNGCLAIVQDKRPAFQYPTQQTDMGPFLPDDRRR
ncbi:MAG: WYL domain-containing protein [Pseudomonadota bacterium]|nr:MAG: WYL domain-containing protein [Pseudomonadota bacterium]